MKKIIGKRLTLEEIKAVAKNILAAFDSVCRSNNISYSLCYGTLLGAVRHSGYIPWDDDIDVCMTRENYIKLRKVVRRGDPLDGAFKLMELHTETRFSAPLAKLVDTRTDLVQFEHAEKVHLGVYIDVFVFDKVPENYTKRARLYRTIDILQKIWFVSEIKPMAGDTRIVKKAVRKILNHGNARIVALLIERIAISSSIINKGSSFYGNLMYCVYGREKETFDEKLFSELQEFLFEGSSFMGFKDYDTVLTRFYKNYMVFPPVSERTPHHNYTVVWK